MSGWVRTDYGGGEFIEHVGDIPWHEATLPPRNHQCQPQTRGALPDYVERCACGGARDAADGPWVNVNSGRTVREQARARHLENQQRGGLER